VAKKKAPTKASAKKSAKKVASKAPIQKAAKKTAVKKTANKKVARVPKEIGKNALPALAGQGIVKREKKEAKIPANMTSNEALVGKGKPDEPVPAIAKGIRTKSVAAGKSRRVTVPVRTGVGGGRPGGGGTGELSPTSDTAAGRGYGKKRKKR
jgi:hypothetical protein